MTLPGFVGIVAQKSDLDMASVQLAAQITDVVVPVSSLS